MSECSHKRAPLVVRRRKRQPVTPATRDPQILRPMRFVSLHHHSTFSYLDGFQMPEVHARRIAELNGSAIAMTEHGNVSSHVRLERACLGEKDPVTQEASQAEGIKPIFGCELYTGLVGDRATQSKYHLTVLAKDVEGYRNLLRLVTLSYSEGFHYEPTVSWEMLKRFKRGLIILSGCQGSLLFCSTVGGKMIRRDRASFRRGLRVARMFKQEFGDNYFIEVQAHYQLRSTCEFNPLAERMARLLGIPLVATKDCHYTVPEENEVMKILHNVRPGNKRTLEEQVRDWGYECELCPPTTDRSVYLELRQTGLSRAAALQAVVSTEQIAQDCNVVLPKLPTLEYPLPPGYTDVVTLWRDLLREGWKYRGFHLLRWSERLRAREQLAKEMRIIEDKGFVAYFLTVRDGIVFAKDYNKPPFEHGIPVGPGRGSAAASIAAYLLRITEVDPMLYPNLVFERFIDTTRTDLPDIDTDFDSVGRDIVRDYYVAKYGQDCVNNIGTFTYYKSKLALDDVAKVHKVPPFEVDKIKELLIERSSGDLRASATIEDTVAQFEAAGEVAQRYPSLRRAMELEGNIKQFGVHAAGIVISNGPITEVCAVYERAVKDRMIQVVSLDKHDAERQGLLKLDYLALKTLDMIAEALRLVGMPLRELYNIRLDDERVLDGFRRNDVVGIFQFDGRAVRSVNGSLRPDSFKEICDITALSRPGPLHNGAANEYIEVKRGTRRAERIHPALDAITADTNFQIVYQEQILRIVREIGGFDWTHAAYIRKIISKKLGEQEFNRQIQKYLEGAADIHERFDYPPMSEEVARKIWGMCITAGSYAFNAAHSVSYGMLSYWTMWLKQYHPTVFYAASLSKMPRGANKFPDNHTALMRDAFRRGIEIRPPHPRRSLVSWTAPNSRVLLAGFAQVDGMGEKIGQLIVDFRRGHRVREWDDLAGVQGVGPKTIEKLKQFSTDDDPFRVQALDRKLADAKSQLRDMGLPPTSHNAAEVPYENGADVEVVWIGVALQRNLRDLFESNRARTGEELDRNSVKRPDLNEFLLITGYDGEEVLSVRFNRFVYPRFRRLIWSIKLNHDLIVVRGVKPGWRTAREVYVSDMWVLSGG